MFDLDTILIDFKDSNGSSPWTIREAVEGVQIFGGIGSGKTSGSGRTLALKYLSNGFGGLVLTAKADEKDLWMDYCKQTGRSNDLIVVEPFGSHRFNFLEYESTYKIDGASSFTENIVQVLKTVISSSEEKSGGKSDDRFWDSALDMLILNVVDLCQLAYDKVTVDDLYNIVISALKKKKPASEQESIHEQEDEALPGTFKHAYRAAQKKVNNLITSFESKLTKEQIRRLDEDPKAMEDAILDNVPEAKTFRILKIFFSEQYKNLAEKTRYIIEFSFAGFLHRLLKDPIHSLFCRHQSTFKPEDSLDGKIILINLPIKHYHKVGRDCQVMFKFIWQRAMEKRNIEQNSRPVFLWADEAQHFLHEYDAEYQATARSSRVATVYITQNLPNYHANMGGNKSEYRVKSFLGTLGTKIFHLNSDVDTNMYAAQLLGEHYVKDITDSINFAEDFSIGEAERLILEKRVRPEQFVGLKNGGPKNNFLVEGYVHRQANTFSNGDNYKLITFSQKQNP